MDSKTTHRNLLAVLLLLFGLVLPAQAHEGKNETRKNPNNFCHSLDQLKNKFLGEIEKKDAKALDKLTNRNEKSLKRRELTDHKQADLRAKWDENREEHFAKLREKAQTDEQKRAVQSFIEAINQAMSTRRSAVDAANQVFHNGLLQAQATHRNELNSRIAEFKTAVTDAYGTAKSECERGLDPAIIKTNLKSALQNAREALKAHNSDTKLREAVKALHDARVTAIKTAVENFKTTVVTARDALKTALKEA